MQVNHFQTSPRRRISSSEYQSKAPWRLGLVVGGGSKLERGPYRWRSTIKPHNWDDGYQQLKQWQNSPHVMSPQPLAPLSGSTPDGVQPGWLFFLGYDSDETEFCLVLDLTNMYSRAHVIFVSGPSVAILPKYLKLPRTRRSACIGRSYSWSGTLDLQSTSNEHAITEYWLPWLGE
ncbi:hypothetical protein VFPPC_15591 [Pochonia chlamydosporia 170]|uniref:Uncharacterized protein n=1 Tax=Pochonia chlamydosporia 170 TaxID=1380566 RepID=A0A179FZX9_METCM|nr:hypothetical protein VFPPC_15591 [Pochonia chlamydosporia 170]OAQ70539.1 hypothetical protein VFPPC_15591 [Pochonia chlamydosporia 170]